ncbi:MAG TPA: LysM domain-containing protein, partial [Longimicrobiaceae bacterium]|nr:LysM domain-containing protein [Longimicrobiaceae bacterium]
MYPYQLLTLLSLLVLMGAGGTAAQEAVSRIDTLRAASGSEAELQERWRAPFGVESVGEVAPRPPRAAVVRLEPDTTRRRSARADTASAAAPADTASARTAAPAGRRDTVRVASRPARRDSASTTPAARSTASATRTGSSRTHRVAAGETFFGVARRYSVTPAALRAANPDVDPEGLRAGTVLRVPGGSGSASAAAASGSGARKPATPGTAS